MSDAPTESQVDLQRRLYATYQAARAALPPTGRFMPYDWSPLPDTLSGTWMAYDQMFSDFARELANAINALTNHVRRLKAWATVIDPLSNEEKMEAAHEFIEVLGTAALGLPYVIKSRFAFAAGHLSHQANMIRAGWKDEFSTKPALYLNDVEPFGKPWRSYRRFKLRVEAIGGSAFKVATADFRNAYNHHFPPRLVLGITNNVKRATDAETGKAIYVIGGHGPLNLDYVADILALELERCYAAFEAFQALIQEQADAILAFEAGTTSP